MEAPISFPSEYREAWRFSFAEKEVKGLQGAGEVRLSMLQTVVPPSSHHQEKQNPFTKDVFYRNLKLAHNPGENFSKKRGR